MSGAKTAPVSGVWIRKRGLGDAAHVEVLVELDKVWRRIYRGPLIGFTDGEVSHIVEALGIESAPEDDLR